MRYWVKFGDAFAAQTYQICVIGESEAKFCGQIWNMRYRPKLGDAFVCQNFKHQLPVIGESAAKLMWPVTPGVKHALSAKVRRRFCSPKFQMATTRYQCMARTRRFN